MLYHTLDTLDVFGFINKVKSIDNTISVNCFHNTGWPKTICHDLICNNFLTTSANDMRFWDLKVEGWNHILLVLSLST